MPPRPPAARRTPNWAKRGRSATVANRRGERSDAVAREGIRSERLSPLGSDASTKSLLLTAKREVVEQKGFEPSTPTLRTWCSPN